MRNLFRFHLSSLAYVFFATLLATVGVYLFRGFGLLGFLPGGAILGMLFLTVLTGILYGVERIRRF